MAGCMIEEHIVALVGLVQTIISKNIAKYFVRWISCCYNHHHVDCARLVPFASLQCLVFCDIVLEPWSLRWSETKPQNRWHQTFSCLDDIFLWWWRSHHYVGAGFRPTSSFTTWTKNSTLEATCYWLREHWWHTWTSATLQCPMIPIESPFQVAQWWTSIEPTVKSRASATTYSSFLNMDLLLLCFRRTVMSFLFLIIPLFFVNFHFFVLLRFHFLEQ